MDRSRATLQAAGMEPDHCPEQPVNPELERILAAERRAKAALSDPTVAQLDIGAFNPTQLGLQYVMVDPIGRLWDTGSRPMKMIFDPQGRLK